MADFDAKAEIESLRAMLSDVVSKQNRAALPPTVPAEASGSTSASVVPFWEVTLATSLTLTAGISDNWSPRFDDLTVATNRRKFYKVTAGGELTYIHIGATTGKRFKICWDSDTAQTIPAHISENRSDDLNDRTIQVNLNGQLYEYAMAYAGTNEYWLTLEGKAGRNELTICVTYAPFTPTFEAVLFDGKTSRWVDPRDGNDYVKN